MNLGQIHNENILEYEEILLLDLVTGQFRHRVWGGQAAGEGFYKGGQGFREELGGSCVYLLKPLKPIVLH